MMSGRKHPSKPLHQQAGQVHHNGGGSTCSGATNNGNGYYSPERRKRSRDDRFFSHCGGAGGKRQQERVVLFVLLTVVIFLGISALSSGVRLLMTSSPAGVQQPKEKELVVDKKEAHLRQHHQQRLQRTTRGLYTPLAASHFTPIPNSSRRKACIPWSQTTVIRAFKQRGWDVVLYDESLHLKHKELKKCAMGRALHGGGTGSGTDGGGGVVLWGKHRPASASVWSTSQPWQRHNWIPYQNFMSSKGALLRALTRHAFRTGDPIDSLPDSYVLPLHTQSFLDRMLGTTTGAQNNKDLAAVVADGAAVVASNVTGFGEPWVLKLAATDNGIGIAILGPHSENLKTLVRLLQSSKDNNNNDKSMQDDIMPEIREQLVFKKQVNDTRDLAKVKRARDRSAKLNDDIIIQRYVCNELDYYGRKFDLRIFYLIASVDPLVVYYHDGTLRVALSEYNDKDFSSTGNHLTNIGRNRVIDNCTASFAEWEVTLKAHVAAANPNSFSEVVRRDPLQHIRKQIMHALADVVASVRDTAFSGHDAGITRTENGFALMGADFIVDRDLHVWITETQSSPGLGHETSTRTELYNRLLPSMVDIVDEVLEKQGAGKPLFPMQNTGDFELIYTDDFQYQYDFPRRKLKRGPC